MNVIAIIPARGGSKGIPRKNVHMLCGKPLIAWTIEAARGAGRVDRVIVSTDDSEIAAVSRAYGAEVVARPAELSGDAASSESALLHVLDHLEKTETSVPELLVFLQCSSPLTTSEDIDGTVEALLDEEADSALAVAPFHYFVWKRQASGQAEGVNHDKATRPRRQDRESQYVETGAVYVMRTEGFRRAGHRFFGKTVVHEIPAERCFEIDEPIDLRVAGTLLADRQRRRRADLLPAKIGALVLDFDGVFTDNTVTVLQDGTEAVTCHRGDGMGLGMLKRTGIPILVLSTESNPVVRVRCQKLGLECVHAVDDKAALLSGWVANHQVDLASVVFVGNDVNDIACLKAVGCGIVVSDAHPSALAVAKIVLEHEGGRGLLRELCDLILGRSNGGSWDG